MKILPCEKCGQARAGAQPYYCASYPGLPGYPLVYKCSQCRSPNTINVTQFNALPDITPAELGTLGLLDHLARDLTLGGEIPLEQARDLFSAGLTPEILAALPVQERADG